MPVGDSNTTRKRLTKLQGEVTGRLFCASCQQHCPPGGGRHRVTKGGTRFICAVCTARIAEAARRAA